ncbi:MAG: hypothetical protein LUC89_00730 [Oscillospiraceae bacterium]|nr:hypothetical protein [Oscillospiraceae bacterium]
MKRILSLLLVVVFVFALVAVPVVAAYDDPPPPPDGGDEAPPEGGSETPPSEDDEIPEVPVSGDSETGDGETGDGENGDGENGDGENGDGENGDGENDDTEVTDTVNEDGTVDTERLEATIEAGIELGISELENAEEMQSAMDDAQVLLARIEAGDETVTQAEVDAATAALQAEIDKATAAEDSEETEETDETNGTVDSEKYVTENGVNYAALIAAIDAARGVAIEQLSEEQQTAVEAAIEVLEEAEAYNEAVEAQNEAAAEGTDSSEGDAVADTTAGSAIEVSIEAAKALQEKVNDAVEALNAVGIVAENTTASGETSGEVGGETNNESSSEPSGGSGEPGGGMGGPGGAPGGMGGASGEAKKTYGGEEVAIILNTAVAATDAESEILAYFRETLSESTDGKITVTVNYEVEVEADEELDTLEPLADGEAQIVAFARTEYRNRIPLINAVPDFTPATAQNTVDYYKNLFQDDEDAAAALEEEGKENGATYLAAFVVKDEVGDGFSGGNLLVADLEWWETLSDEAQEFILQAAQDTADYSAELIDGSGASGEASGEAGGASGEAAAIELTDEELEEWATAINSAATRAKNTATELEKEDQFKAVIDAAADFIGVDRPEYDF